jgi:hypothetical protein
VPFGRIVQQITAALRHPPGRHRRRQGGLRTARRVANEVPFQISQRADFFEEEVGLETTLKRPIVNTRDEPHCDPTKYRRLHVIVGDANMSETATLVKLGATSIVLAMIEDDVLTDEFTLASPVSAIRQVSHDPSLQRTVLLRDGRRVTALEVQWGLLEAAKKYERSHGLDAVGEDVGREVLALWEQMLTGLERDPDTVAHQVDWVAKRRVVQAYAERHGARADDARLKALDLQYHDLRARQVPGPTRRAGRADHAEEVHVTR